MSNHPELLEIALEPLTQILDDPRIKKASERIESFWHKQGDNPPETLDEPDVDLPEQPGNDGITPTPRKGQLLFWLPKLDDAIELLEQAGFSEQAGQLKVLRTSLERNPSDGPDEKFVERLQAVLDGMIGSTQSKIDPPKQNKKGARNSGTIPEKTKRFSKHGTMATGSTGICTSWLKLSPCHIKRPNSP